MSNDYYRLLILLLIAGFLLVTAAGCISEIAERQCLVESYTYSCAPNSPDGNNVVFTGWSEYKYFPGFALQGKQKGPIGEQWVLIALSVEHYEGRGNLEVYLASRTIANNPKYWKDWKNLTNNRAHDGCPAWASDGTKIAFCSLRDGHSQVYIMDVNGTNVKRLTNTEVDKVNTDFLIGDKQVMFTTMSKISFSGKTTREPQSLVVNIDGSGNETPSSAFAIPYNTQKVPEKVDMDKIRRYERTHAR